MVVHIDAGSHNGPHAYSAICRDNFFDQRTWVGFVVGCNREESIQRRRKYNRLEDVSVFQHVLDVYFPGFGGGCVGLIESCCLGIVGAIIVDQRRYVSEVIGVGLRREIGFIWQHLVSRSKI